MQARPVTTSLLVETKPVFRRCEFPAVLTRDPITIGACGRSAPWTTEDTRSYCDRHCVEVMLADTSVRVEAVAS